MKISEKRKKWLTKRAFRNCMVISIGLLIISYAFEFARLIISAKLPFHQHILFTLFVLLLIALFLWGMGLLFPDYMETVFTMLGFKEKENNNDEDKT